MNDRLPAFIPLNYPPDETFTSEFLGCCLSNPLDPYQNFLGLQGIAPTPVRASVTIKANNVNPNRNVPICEVVRQVSGYKNLLRRIVDVAGQSTNIRNMDPHAKSAYLVVRVISRGEFPVSPQNMPSNQVIQLAINPPPAPPPAPPGAPLPPPTALLQPADGWYRVINSPWFQNHIWPTEEIYGFEACKITLKPKRHFLMNDGNIETSGRVIRLDDVMDSLI
jgi:hypothetical protein